MKRKHKLIISLIILVIVSLVLCIFNIVRGQDIDECELWFFNNDFNVSPNVWNVG